MKLRFKLKTDNQLLIDAMTEAARMVADMRAGVIFTDAEHMAAGDRFDEALGQLARTAGVTPSKTVPPMRSVTEKRFQHVTNGGTSL